MTSSPTGPVVDDAATPFPCVASGAVACAGSWTHGRSCVVWGMQDGMDLAAVSVRITGQQCSGGGGLSVGQPWMSSSVAQIRERWER